MALWQAHHTQHLLAQLDIESELKIIQTKGDQIQNLSFDKIEGKGFFTKEIEAALVEKEIDIAVHSHKDLDLQVCLSSFSPLFTLYVLVLVLLPNYLTF